MTDIEELATSAAHDFYDKNGPGELSLGETSRRFCQAVEQGIRLHEAHVGEFLTELHATMIDPLAEGSIPVQEMCKLLLERARQDREALKNLRTALAPFAALLDKAGLENVGGGTLISPTIKVQLVKDAQAALE